MAISQYMETKVVTCPATATLKESARLMKANNVGTVVVQKNGKPEGIITDRDLAVKALANGKDIETTLVTEIMSRPIVCSNLKDGVYEVIAKMKKSKIRRMPVVNASGKVVGIISFGDIVGLLSDEFSDLSQAVLSHKSHVAKKAA